jgi:hypothetical protein
MMNASYLQESVTGVSENMRREFPNTVENATAPMSINKRVHGIATSKISNNSQEQELNSIKLLLN